MKRAPLLLVAALLPLAAAAETYRWKDDQGQVHYSQTVPPGRAYDVVGGAPPPAAAPNQEHLNQALSQSQKDAAAQQDAVARAQQEKAALAERCLKARAHLAQMDELTARRMVHADGKAEPVRYTDEDFARERAAWEKDAASSCR